MKPIFEEADLTICEVPVPKGYQQSQTHAGVAVWNERVYLCTSPFPQVKHGRFVGHWRGLLRRISKGRLPFEHGENEENPMIYMGASEDCSPVKFTPYIGNPVVNIPPALFGFPAFNSDPDIYIENGMLYILNREYIRKIPPGSKHYIGDSLIRLDMVQFSISQKGLTYVKTKIFKETSTDNILSPSLIKIGDKYCIFYLDTFSYLYQEAECSLYMMQDTTIDGSYKERHLITIDSDNFVPWHLSVFKHNEKLYAVIACVKKGQPGRLYQMLGEFSDGLASIKIYQKPLIDLPSYRGCAYVDSNLRFVLYSTTDRYRLRGSNSVDGKDVVLAEMNFYDLMSKLQDER